MTEITDEQAPRFLGCTKSVAEQPNDQNLPISQIIEQRAHLNSTIITIGAEARSIFINQRSHQESPAETELRAAFEWNNLQDLSYSHHIDGFDNVLHIFQRDWAGVRAASGSLPGKKLAISLPAGYSPRTIAGLGQEIISRNPNRIVIQGMSDTMGAIICFLQRAGWGDRIFIVLHGAPAQWFAPDEGRYAFMCLDFARTGKIRRLHVMKPNFEFPGARLYKPMLFNLSPRIEKLGFAEETPHAGPDRALIPGWSGWRKNIHTNALGAALSNQVKEVWAFGSDLTLPEPLAPKIRIIPFQGREQTFQLMAVAALVMNVSLVDCHPMVQVESQTLGRACLRGPLFLDALEDHPYVALTMVRDPTSVMEIKEVVERVLAVPAEERSELARDYQRQSDTVAISRYREFLEL